MGGGKIIIGRRPWGEAISPIVLQKPTSLMQASPPFPQKPLFFAETKVHIRLLQVFSERNYIFFKKISTRDILVFQGIYNYKSVKRQSSLQSDPSFWRWMERTDCVEKNCHLRWMWHRGKENWISIRRDFLGMVRWGQILLNTFGGRVQQSTVADCTLHTNQIQPDL